MTSKLTQYGFQFGAATVERLASHKGYAVIGIRTPRARLEIHVTPTGLLRVREQPPLSPTVLDYDAIAEQRRRG